MNQWIDIKFPNQHGSITTRSSNCCREHKALSDWLTWTELQESYFRVPPLWERWQILLLNQLLCWSAIHSCFICENPVKSIFYAFFWLLRCAWKSTLCLLVGQEPDLLISYYRALLYGTLIHCLNISYLGTLYKTQVQHRWNTDSHFDEMAMNWRSQMRTL